MVELLAPRAQDKGIEIALDVADDLRAARGRRRRAGAPDPGQPRRATPSSSPTRAASASPSSRHSEGLALAISDTGPGIPEERIPILFEEFEQGDSSASSPHEGTGLGLAITRRLVARMGGRIEAESRLGRGSTFRVVLPLPEAPAAAAGRSAVDLGGRRILIVAAFAPSRRPTSPAGCRGSGAAAVVVPTLEAGLAALAGRAVRRPHRRPGPRGRGVRRLADAARASGVRCSLDPALALRPARVRRAGGGGLRQLPDQAGAGPLPVRPPARPGPHARAPGAGRRRSAAGAGGGGRGGGGRAPGAPRRGQPDQRAPRPQALERLGARVVLARDGLEAPGPPTPTRALRPRADRHPHAGPRRARDRAAHPRRGGGAPDGRAPPPRRPTANAGREDERRPARPGSTDSCRSP